MINKTLQQSLEKLLELEKAARDFGFNWPNSDVIIGQIMSEASEVQKAIQDGREPEIKEEIGDMIAACVALCAYKNYDLGKIIDGYNHKFESRMEIVQTLAKEKGLTSLNGQSTDFMLKLWDKAKAILKSK